MCSCSEKMKQFVHKVSAFPRQVGRIKITINSLVGEFNWKKRLHLSEKVKKKNKTSVLIANQ